MTGRTTQPILGILDDADAPEARMLVVLYGRTDAPRYEYVSPHIRPLRPAPGPRRRPALFTPLSEFGVEAAFEPDGRLRTRQTAPSRATYPDGVHRPWQDRRDGLVSVRPALAGPVMRAVRASARDCAPRPA